MNSIASVCLPLLASIAGFLLLLLLLFYHQGLLLCVKAVYCYNMDCFLWSFVVSHAWRRGWEYFSKTHGNLLLGSQRWQCKQGGSRTVGFEAALTLQDIADEAKGLCLSRLTAKAALVHWLNISHSASLGKHLFIMIRPASSWEFFCSSLKNKKQKNTWT